MRTASPRVLRRGLRPADASRLLLGASLLVVPDAFVSLAGASSSGPVRRTIRVLGLRYLIQAVVAPVVHRPWVRPALL